MKKLHATPIHAIRKYCIKVCSITPKEVKREENFSKFSALLFIGAIITNYFLNDDHNNILHLLYSDSKSMYL